MFAFLHKGNVVGHYDGFIRALFRALILALLGRYAWPPPPPLPFPSPSPPSPYTPQRPGPHSFPFSGASNWPKNRPSIGQCER